MQVLRTPILVMLQLSVLVLATTTFSSVVAQLVILRSGIFYSINHSDISKTPVDGYLESSHSRDLI